jgi:hypothetical protein
LKNVDPHNFKKSQSPKTKLFQANLGSLHFKELPCSPSQSPTKQQSSCFTFGLFRDTGAQPGQLHLNSAPNEATPSIWLKAMMVRSDLSRNTEFLENESGTEVERWEPEGRSPEGQVGVDSDRRTMS